MTKRFVYLRPLRVIYVRATGPYRTSSVHAWDRMLPWLDETNLRDGLVCGYGLARDNPDFTDPEKCRYDACVEMPTGMMTPLPADFGVQTLPGGAYKRERHIGSYQTLRDTLHRMRDDLPITSGLVVDKRRPVVAIYLDDPRKCPEERLRSDLCLPVISQEQFKAVHDAA